ncbi:Gfo/Idh/MocA family protein [Streptomyces sp. NPDC058001]|uniref:Gfo/Idh/MocA family protein n=1 Tax=Streptomyces sp. NPDC058001 TaxID=3346300 RepID=UPI0036E3C13A
MSPPRVALAGTGGYGAVHFDNIERLVGAGRLRFAGCTDLRPPGPDMARRIATLGGSFAEDYDTLLKAEPDIVVVATPPHLHRGMVCAAHAAGAHVLVEKPPTVRLADLDAMTAAASAADRLCQVGFQSLGSEALVRLRKLMDDGELGEVTHIGATGCWARSDSYYTRAPWAGRRRLDGVEVGDGALSNPFAHAVMNCLALSGVGASELPYAEAELYRTRPIEVEDTGCLRLTTPGRPPITIAVTLCAETPRPPYVLVRGDRGSARWWYQTDRLEIATNGRPAVTTEHTRVDLLDDLLQAIDGPEADLRSPLRSTRPFVGVVEWLAGRPVRTVAIGARRRHDDELGPRNSIVGVEEDIERAVAQSRLFSELRPRPGWL